MAREVWTNDLYAQLATAPAKQANPIAAALLETLDDRRFQQLRDTLLDELHLYPGAQALELGCGPGILLEGMHQRLEGDGQIHGLDLNPHFINVAKRRAQLLEIENAEFVTADCHTLPFEKERFDAVVAEKLLMHVAPLRRVLQEIARVLTPGGRVALADYDPYTIMAAGPDPALTARVMTSAAELYASPSAARETAQACAQAGLTVESVRGYLQVFEDAKLPTVAGMPEVWHEHAAAGRQVDRGTARRWLKAIEMAATQGRFLVAIPFIITVATKRND